MDEAPSMEEESLSVDEEGNDTEDAGS